MCVSVQIMKMSSFKLNSSIESNVKLAGEEAKDRLYEPKHKKKLVRVLTVVAYLFLVSLAAIMLSLYYVFLWNGGNSNGQHWRSGGPGRTYDGAFQRCLHDAGSVAAMQLAAEATTLSPENGTRLDGMNVAQESPFFEKLIQYSRVDY